MNWRKIIAGIAAIITFIGILMVIGTVIHAIWPDYWFSDHPIERFFALIPSAIIASTIYNLIKGNKPEPEIKDKQTITSDEISKKLAKKRKKTQ